MVGTPGDARLATDPVLPDSRDPAASPQTTQSPRPIAAAARVPRGARGPSAAPPTGNFAGRKQTKRRFNVIAPKGTAEEDAPVVSHNAAAMGSAVLATAPSCDGADAHFYQARCAESLTSRA